MRSLKRYEVLGQLPFQKNQFPFLYSFTEELLAKQQSSFLSLRYKSAAEPKWYNEFKEANKLRDRLNLLNLEIEVTNELMGYFPTKTNEKISVIYKNAV